MSDPVVEQPAEQAPPVAETYAQPQQGFGLLGGGLMMPQIGAGFQVQPFQAKFATGLEPQSGLLHQSIVPQSNFVFYAESPEPPAYTESNTISDDVVPAVLKTRDATLASKKEKPSAWCACWK